MARHDIMPAVSEHGGHSRTIGFPVGANTTIDTADTSWQVGELVTIDGAAGDINASADGALDPAGGLIHVAAGSSQGEIVKAGGLGATTGAADGNLTPVWTFEPGVEFKTRNVFDNSDTNIGPGGSGAMTGVIVGETCDLWRDDTAATGAPNGTFGIDINGNHFIITRIVDSRGQSTSISGDTADLVYFARLSG